MSEADEELPDGELRPPPPLVSTLGHAMARQRLRAALLGETMPAIRVDRFALVRELGQGGMGTVWLAHDDALGRQVALKFLRRTLEGEAGEQRLQAEAQSLAKLSHPNVIPVYDVGRHEGRVWVAMEFVPGRTLREWITEERPTPRQRLEAWLEVGRGLATVHAAGLVHRDVKPDNALRGHDGRVRLIDFGLVRKAATVRPGHDAQSTLGGSPTALSPSEQSRTDEPADAEPMTATGQFVGTPAYAAPEQRAGEAVDARADQFSFCMSVWEALCGQRPSLRELPARTGQLVRAPRSMSTRIRRALSRGLGCDPALRFETMDALLEALAPRRGRLVAMAAGGVGLLMGAAGLVTGLLAAPAPDPCTETDASLLERWNDDTRGAVAALGGGVGELAVGAIDDFAGRWRQASERACVEVEVEQVRSPRSLDVRRACLEAQLVELDVLVDALRREPVSVHRVGPWLAALDEPLQCLAPSRLEGEDEVVSPELQPVVAELQRKLFALLLGASSGTIEERRAEAARTAERARGIGHRRTEARAQVVQGYLAQRGGDASAAREHYGEVLDLGMELADPSVAEEGWYGLAEVALELDADSSAADWLLRRDRQALERMGEPARRVARAEVERGRWHLLRGERDRAEAITREAVTLLEQAGPTARWVLAGALRNLANVVAADGRAAEALALQERARRLEGIEDAESSTMARADLGDAALSRALTLRDAGDLEGATAKLLEALEVTRTERGPRSAAVGHVHLALAGIYDARGDVAAARHHAIEAEQLARETLGVGHPDRINASSALGTAEFREGHYERAIEHYQRVLELAELAGDAMTPEERALHRANLGEALFRAGLLARAEPVLRRAVTELEAAVGPDHPDLAIPTKALGEVMLAQGDAAGARDRLAHALDLFVRHGTNDAEQAETRWALARAQLASGDRPQALRTATAALTELSALGPDWAPRATELRTWIEHHDGQPTEPR